MSARQVVVVALVAMTAMATIACGDDDDESTTGDDKATGEAVAPPPERAFRNFSAALEAQGLVVAPLARRSLTGAEAGVEISGDKQGEARSFATQAEAQAYSAKVVKDGAKSVIVGTVVIEAPAQDDADFFADAYEGG